MTARRQVLAVDLGAESGRVVLGRFDGAAIGTEEVHRFANVPRRDGDGVLRWNLSRLWSEVRDGLAKAAALADGPVDSVGVDTWGLDYGFVDAHGAILDDPVSHRDGRTRGMLAEAARLVGRDRLYADTGIQLLEVNTVFQLLADERSGTGRHRRASRMLMLPDLFHRLLSGSAVAEYTAVSTSGAYDMTRRRWAVELLSDLGIPTGVLPEVVEPGTDLGALLPEAADHSAYRRTRVVAPGSHDTASAVVSVPFEEAAAEGPAAYISSGTWSLVGVESDAPVVDEGSRRANLTNEGGVLGTIRLLRNCMGLWLLQECRNHWAREGREYGYGELVALAARAPAGRSVVNPDHRDFVEPGDMPARIREYCTRTGQPVPDGVAETVRTVLDSLALGYRMALEDLALVTGRQPAAAHIVGGGSRNALLNQLTADASGLPVLAGPVEATAVGNMLVQLLALGELADLSEMRAVVRAGQRVGRYEPGGAGAAEECYGRYREWVAADSAEAGITD
ncbi:rhamnulokinase [Streptomyces winkii]|uniref:rhamnulokinase n=1 Tax=Streptomyces winkii TaxID=3051178 RepID=UPI0028D5B69D|nr:rhamnulokinase family protein [Streptomyces sp. DSM 40971]